MNETHVWKDIRKRMDHINFQDKTERRILKDNSCFPVEVCYKCVENINGNRSAEAAQRLTSAVLLTVAQYECYQVIGDMIR